MSAAAPIIVGAPCYQSRGRAAPLRRLPVLDSVALAREFARGTYRRNGDGDLERRCTRCLGYYPADTEFFYSQPHKTDGLHQWCKACYSEWRHTKGADGTAQLQADGARKPPQREESLPRVTPQSERIAARTERQREEDLAGEVRPDDGSLDELDCALVAAVGAAPDAPCADDLYRRCRDFCEARVDVARALARLVSRGVLAIVDPGAEVRRYRLGAAAATAAVADDDLERLVEAVERAPARRRSLPAPEKVVVDDGFDDVAAEDTDEEAPARAARRTRAGRPGRATKKPCPAKEKR